MFNKLLTPATFPVTLFDSVMGTKGTPSTLEAVFETIRSDQRVEAMTVLHRTGEEQKRRMPCFVPSAVMTGRRVGSIRELTGLIYFDIDHVDELEMMRVGEFLRACSYVLGYYRSASGKGLHVVCSYVLQYYSGGEMPLTDLHFDTPEAERRSKWLWSAIWEECRRQFEDYPLFRDLKVDTQCKDLNRMSILCHDADAFLAPSGLPMTVILTEGMLNYGNSRTHCATGRPVGRPSKTATQRAFESAEAYAHSQGLQPGAGHFNRFVSTVLYEVNRYGIAEEEAAEEARRRYPSYGDGAKGITAMVRSIWSKHADEAGTLRMKRDLSDRPRSHKATSHEIEEYLREQGEFRRNVITHRIEVRWKAESLMVEYQQRNAEALAWGTMLSDNESQHTGLISQNEGGEGAPFVPLTDADVATLMRLFNEATDLTIAYPNVVMTVLMSDTCSMPFNPLADYLRPLVDRWQPGDRDYLREFTDTVLLADNAADREMLEDLFARWMVGMVHGWIRRSSTHGTILTFIGPQGIGKSSWMRMLMPPELRAYYKEQTKYRNLDKDDRIALAEFGLINLEEIDALSDSDLNQLKSLVTLESIKERLPYGKNPETLPRVATFCATGNRTDFLTDPTGNRRWLAFSVSGFTINPFEYHPDYEGIYAQALFLALHPDQAGRYNAETGQMEPWRFAMDLRDIQRLESHNEQYVAQTAEVELLQAFVTKPDGSRPGEWKTAAEVASRIGMFNPSVKLSHRNMGIALKKAGFESRMRRGVLQYLVNID